MPAPAFHPPHPVPVFRLLKTAWRKYLAGGNAISIEVATPPGQLASAATPVSGTVWRDRAAPMPAQLLVWVTQSGTPKGQKFVTPDRVTGVFSTTIPGGTLVAGTATLTAATVAGALPNGGTTTPAFTLT